MFLNFVMSLLLLRFMIIKLPKFCDVGIYVPIVRLCEAWFNIKPGSHPTWFSVESLTV
jgi:hypothetical protein